MKLREVLDRINDSADSKKAVDESKVNRSESKVTSGDTVIGADGAGGGSYTNETEYSETVTKERTIGEIPDELKISWIGQLDGQIRCEIFGEKPENVTLPKWEEDELAVPDAYSALYFYHVLAMIALLRGNTKEYDKFCHERDSVMTQYAKCVIRSRN